MADEVELCIYELEDMIFLFSDPYNNGQTNRFQ